MSDNLSWEDWLELLEREELNREKQLNPQEIEHSAKILEKLETDKDFEVNKIEENGGSTEYQKKEEETTTNNFGSVKMEHEKLLQELKYMEIAEKLFQVHHYHHAIKVLEKSSSNSNSQLYMFLIYHFDTTLLNHEKAIYWGEKSAEQGNKIAQNCVGYCYEKGLGVEKNDIKAFNFYLQSANNGCIEAYFNLARVFSNDFDIPHIPVNSFKALYYFNLIINTRSFRNFPNFLVKFVDFNWIFEYFNRFSVSTKLSKKFWTWIYQLAKEQSLKEAQYHLGKFLIFVSLNSSKANSRLSSQENLNFSGSYKINSVDQVNYIESLYYTNSTVLPPAIINLSSYQSPTTSPSTSPTFSPMRSPSPMTKRNYIIKEAIWEGFRWALLSAINGSIDALETLKSYHLNEKIPKKLRGHIAFCIGKLYNEHHFIAKPSSTTLQYIQIKKVEPLLTSWKYDRKLNKILLYSWVECVKGRDINFQESGRKQSRLYPSEGAILYSPLQLYSFHTSNPNSHKEVIDDYENAKRWYYYGFTLGHKESQIPSLRKHDCSKFHSKAIRLLENLAKQKYLAANYQIARLYLFFTVDIRNIDLHEDNSNNYDDIFTSPVSPTIQLIEKIHPLLISTQSMGSIHRSDSRTIATKSKEHPSPSPHSYSEYPSLHTRSSISLSNPNSLNTQRTASVKNMKSGRSKSILNNSSNSNSNNNKNNLTINTQSLQNYNYSAAGQLRANSTGVVNVNNSNSSEISNSQSNNIIDENDWKERQKEEGIKHMITAAENYVPAQFELSIILEEFSRPQSPHNTRKRRKRSSSEASFHASNNQNGSQPNISSAIPKNVPSLSLSSSKEISPKKNMLAYTSLSPKEWCLCAASKGWPPALYKIAFELENANKNQYKSNSGNDPDMAKARELYQKAADKSYAPAIIKLSKIYLSKKVGISQFQSKDKAISLLQNPASYGCVEAQLLLSNLYLNGHPSDVQSHSIEKNIHHNQNINNNENNFNTININEENTVNISYPKYQNCANILGYSPIRSHHSSNQFQSTLDSENENEGESTLFYVNNNSKKSLRDIFQSYKGGGNLLDVILGFHWSIKASQLGSTEGIIKITEAWNRSPHPLIQSVSYDFHTPYTYLQLYYISSSRRLERLQTSVHQIGTFQSLTYLQKLINLFDTRYHSHLPNSLLSPTSTSFLSKSNLSSPLQSPSSLKNEQTINNNFRVCSPEREKDDQSFEFEYDEEKNEDLEFLVVASIAMAILYEKHSCFAGHIYYSYQWWLKAWDYLLKFPSIYYSIYSNDSPYRPANSPSNLSPSSSLSPTSPSSNLLSPSKLKSPNSNQDKEVKKVDNSSDQKVKEEVEDVDTLLPPSIKINSSPTIHKDYLNEKDGEKENIIIDNEKEEKKKENLISSKLFSYFLLLLWKLSNNKIEKFSDKLSAEVTDKDVLSAIIFSPKRSKPSKNDTSPTKLSSNTPSSPRSSPASPRNNADQIIIKDPYAIHSVLTEFIQTYGLNVSDPIEEEDTYPIIIKASIKNDIKTVDHFINKFHASEIRHDDITIALQTSVNHAHSEIKLLLIRILRETKLEMSFKEYLRDRAEKETLEINYIQEQIMLLTQLKNMSEVDLLSVEKKKIYEFLEELGPIRAASLAQDLKPVLKRIQPAELLLDHSNSSFSSKILNTLTGNKIRKFSSLFKPLNQTIKMIDNICTKYFLKNKEKYKTIIQSLHRIILYYEKKKDTICDLSQYDGEYESQLLSCFQMNSMIYIPGTGVRVLNKEAANHLLPSTSSPNARLSGQEEYGSHIIRVYQGIHFKGDPHAPGVEFMVDSLNKIIAGQGSAPTELLKVYRCIHPNQAYFQSLLSPSQMMVAHNSNHININGTVNSANNQIIPIQYNPMTFSDSQLKKEEMIYIASKTVVGANLQFILEQHPEYIYNNEDIIDSINYSAMVVSGLLTSPHDGKPDNFMVELRVDKSQKVTQMSIVGIDNDIAFASPIISIQRGSLKGSHQVGIKNVLYFFPQMNKPIDQRFVLLFLKNIPEMIVIYWLSSILLKNQSYQQLIDSSIFTNEEFENLHLPIKFVKGTVNLIYEKILKIQKELIQNPTITHNQLFKVIEPVLYYYYDGIMTTVKNDRGSDCNYIMESITKIYSASAPTIEEILQDHTLFPSRSSNQNGEENEDIFAQYLQSLSGKENGLFDFEDKRDTNVIDEVESFLSTLNYSNFDYNTHILLFSHISELKELRYLTVKNSAYLDYGLLVRILDKLSNLRKLTLIRCSKMDQNALQTLEDRFPNLVIRMQSNTDSL